MKEAKEGGGAVSRGRQGSWLQPWNEWVQGKIDV